MKKRPRNAYDVAGEAAVRPGTRGGKGGLRFISVGTVGGMHMVDLARDVDTAIDTACMRSVKLRSSNEPLEGHNASGVEGDAALGSVLVPATPSQPCAFEDEPAKCCGAKETVTAVPNLFVEAVARTLLPEMDSVRGAVEEEDLCNSESGGSRYCGDDDDVVQPSGMVFGTLAPEDIPESSPAPPAMLLGRAEMPETFENAHGNESYESEDCLLRSLGFGAEHPPPLHARDAHDVDGSKNNQGSLSIQGSPMNLPPRQMAEKTAGSPGALEAMYRSCEKQRSERSGSGTPLLLDAMAAGRARLELGLTPDTSCDGRPLVIDPTLARQAHDFLAKHVPVTPSFSSGPTSDGGIGLETTPVPRKPLLHSKSLSTDTDATANKAVANHISAVVKENVKPSFGSMPTTVVHGKSNTLESACSFTNHARCESTPRAAQQGYSARMMTPIPLPVQLFDDTREDAAAKSTVPKRPNTDGLACTGTTVNTGILMVAENSANVSMDQVLKALPSPLPPEDATSRKRTEPVSMLARNISPVLGNSVTPPPPPKSSIALQWSTTGRGIPAPLLGATGFSTAGKGAPVVIRSTPTTVFNGRKSPPPMPLSTAFSSHGTRAPELHTRSPGKSVRLPGKAGSVIEKKEVPMLPRSTPVTAPNDVMPSFFTTGNGTAVPIAAPPINTGFATAGKRKAVSLLPLSSEKRPTLDPSAPLFTNGKGQSVPLPSRTRDVPVTSLFFTGRGHAVNASAQACAQGMGVSRGGKPPLSPHTPVLPDQLRNSRANADGEANHASARALVSRDETFHERRQQIAGYLPQRLEFENGTPLLNASGFPLSRSRTVGSSASRVRPPSPSTMRSTPFKKPRRIAPQSSLAQCSKAPKTERETSLSLPTGDVPRLSSLGRLVAISNVSSIETSPVVLSHLEKHPRENLSSCMSQVFSRVRFGDVSCLPNGVQSSLDIANRRSFGVEECVAWISGIFLGVSTKPATRIGSAAWTRMSYSLAVWKLARLELESVSHKPAAFLTAANVVRELLRRIDVEWNQTRSPHLVQMVRRDAAPGAHVVLMITDMIDAGSKHKKTTLEVSDGWYVARASADSVLTAIIRLGRLKIGDKIHVSGATLGESAASANMPKTSFFFGDGDELGAVTLKLSANSVKRVLDKFATTAKLGLRRDILFTRSFRTLHPGGGTSVYSHVVVQRSYPIFYVENVQTTDNDGETTTRRVFRRADAEDAAREQHHQELAAAAATSSNPELMQDAVMRRESSLAVDTLICGIDDDASDPSACHLVRLYRPTEEVLELLGREGAGVQLPPMKTDRRVWTSVTACVRPVSLAGLQHPIPFTPRTAASISDLFHGAVLPKQDFDGVFAVVLVADADDLGRRFVYLADDPHQIRLLALELNDVDAVHLPRPLNLSGASAKRYPRIALRDAEFVASQNSNDIVHAKATLRTSIASAASVLKAKGGTSVLKNALKDVEQAFSAGLAEVDILREAVTSFVVGRRKSVGAYFLSTQETQ